MSTVSALKAQFEKQTKGPTTKEEHKTLQKVARTGQRTALAVVPQEQSSSGKKFFSFRKPKDPVREGAKETLRNGILPRINTLLSLLNNNGTISREEVSQELNQITKDFEKIQGNLSSEKVNLFEKNFGLVASKFAKAFPQNNPSTMESPTIEDASTSSPSDSPSNTFEELLKQEQQEREDKTLKEKALQARQNYLNKLDQQKEPSPPPPPPPRAPQPPAQSAAVPPPPPPRVQKPAGARADQLPPPPPPRTAPPKPAAVPPPPPRTAPSSQASAPQQSALPARPPGVVLKSSQALARFASPPPPPPRRAQPVQGRGNLFAGLEKGIRALKQVPPKVEAMKNEPTKEDGSELTAEEALKRALLARRGRQHRLDTYVVDANPVDITGNATEGAPTIRSTFIDETLMSQIAQQHNLEVTAEEINDLPDDEWKTN